MNPTKERMDWVDTLRFLGIGAIYIGHCGNVSGKVYPFVKSYDVQLFFFAAGFFAKSFEKPILVYTREKFQHLMIPYCFFSLFALVFYSLQENWNLPQVIEAGKACAFGIRNQLQAGSTWFLPCLFIISVANYTVLKLARTPIAPFAVSACCWWFTQAGFIKNPLNNPSWIMNLDSAMYYWIYFASGPLLYPLLNKKFSTKGWLSQCASIAFGLCSIEFTVMTFLKGDGWFLGVLFGFIPSLWTFRGPITLAYYIPMTLTIIHVHIMLAKALSRVPLLPQLGRETLVLSGTEHVFRDALSQAILFLGLTGKLLNPVMVILYVGCVLFLSHYTIVRFLITYFPVLVGRPSQQKRMSPLPGYTAPGVFDIVVSNQIEKPCNIDSLEHRPESGDTCGSWSPEIRGSFDTARLGSDG